MLDPASVTKIHTNAHTQACMTHSTANFCTHTCTPIANNESESMDMCFNTIDVAVLWQKGWGRPGPVPCLLLMKDAFSVSESAETCAGHCVEHFWLGMHGHASMRWVG